MGREKERRNLKLEENLERSLRMKRSRRKRMIHKNQIRELWRKKDLKKK